MATCAQTVYLNGQAVIAPVQGTCTEFVLVTPAEYSAMASPFNLSVQDGQTIGWSIAAVWAAAWGVRVLAELIPRHREED